MKKKSTPVMDFTLRDIWMAIRFGIAVIIVIPAQLLCMLASAVTYPMEWNVE